MSLQNAASSASNGSGSNAWGGTSINKRSSLMVGWKVLQASLFVLLLANLRHNGISCLVAVPSSSYYSSPLSPSKASSTQSTGASTTLPFSSSKSSPDNNNDYLQPVSDRVPSAGIENILATSSTNPPFHFFAHAKKNDLVTESLIQTGVYEKDSTTALIRAIVCDYSNNNNNHHKNNDETDEGTIVAVDLGANIGFHSLHMASCGATVISFEASPDTAWLLRSSALLNGYLTDVLPNHNDSPTTQVQRIVEESNNNKIKMGSLVLIPRGVSNITSVGRLSRHKKSPGMTSFVQADKTPFGLQAGSQGTALDVDIPMVRAADVLQLLGLNKSSHDHNQQQRNDDHSTTGSASSNYKLRLLKVDVEGYEYQALQGLDLERYPFDYITLEFFPTLLRASGTDPAELLAYIWSHGYRFLKFHPQLALEDYPEIEITAVRKPKDNYKKSDNQQHNAAKNEDVDREAVYQWAQNLMAQGKVANGADYHVNLLAKKHRS